nr:hypothetical protein [Helicobacter suis]
MYQCSYVAHAKECLQHAPSQHIFDLKSDIEHSILKSTKLTLT